MRAETPVKLYILEDGRESGLHVIVLLDYLEGVDAGVFVL